MRRFRALIKKEITHMIRDPRTLIFIFIMPILQLVLLGYANTTDIKNVSTVIFNQDNSPASRDLLIISHLTYFRQPVISLLITRLAARPKLII